MSSALDLLAELDAEFGKKKKEKKTAFLKETTKKLSRSQFLNNADWRMAQLAQEANETAKRLAQFEQLWKPEAKETWLMRQHCSCCGGYVDYIAGEYVRFRNNHAHCIMKQRAAVHPDLFHLDKTIPEEYMHLEQEVLRCAKCLREEQQVSEIWDKVQEAVLHTAEEQLIIPGLDRE